MQNGNAYGRIREHHLRFVEAGYATVPLYPQSKKPLLELLPPDKNGAPILRPLLDNAASVSTVLHWHDRFPDMNYGLVMGPTNNLFALDIDDRHGGWPGYHEASGGEEYEGPQHRSGDAGAHLLHPYPGTAFGLSEPVRGCQIIQNGYVAAPGSLHPSGNLYTEIISLFDREPTLPHWLRARMCPPLAFPLGREDFQEISLDLTPTNLKLCLDIVSRFEQRRENYQSTSEFDFALLNRLIGEGASPELIFKVFRATSVETKFARLAQKSREGAEKYLLKSYTKAKSTTINSSQARHCEALARFYRYLAEQRLWQGRGMFLRRRVLLSHLDLAVGVRRETWDFSARCGHLATTHSVATFAKYTRLLVAEGWLRVVQKANPGRSRATTYTFGDQLVELGHGMPHSTTENEADELKKCTFGAHTPPPSLPVVVCPQSVHFSESPLADSRSGMPHLAISTSTSDENGTPSGASFQPPASAASTVQEASSPLIPGQETSLPTCGVFERRGLGHAAEAVYLCLKEQGPLAIAHIAQRTGLHRRTVRMALLGRKESSNGEDAPRKAMVPFSLVLQEGRLYRINPDFNQWEQLAVWLGVRHLAELRERTVALQREEHRAQVYFNRARYIKKKYTKPGRW